MDVSASPLWEYVMYRDQERRPTDSSSSSRKDVIHRVMVEFILV